MKEYSTTELLHKINAKKEEHENLKQQALALTERLKRLEDTLNPILEAINVVETEYTDLCKEYIERNEK
jgi:chromosome segregation ATPase